MKKEIVVINGTGGVGKDTFVEAVSKRCKVNNFSSIDEVKKIARLIGWDGKKTEKDRKFLADLKRLIAEYNDMPYNSVKEAVEKFKNSDEELMFIHIREPKEIQRAVDDFGAKTLLIKRDNYENILSNEADALVDQYDYDMIIKTSIEKVDELAMEFTEKLDIC